MKDKITIDRATVEQALKALEVATTPLAKDRQEVLRAQAAIKEALAEPAQQQPVVKQALTVEQPAQQESGEDRLGGEWVPCVKLPVVVHVRNQRLGEQHVSTREGITPVKPDDLIMRGIAGEEYPIGRELWEKTYTTDLTQPAIDKFAATRIDTTLGWEPKKEWVGLTDDEIIEALNGVSFNDLTGFTIARVVEAKLKGKNT